eukprot:gene1709-2367_t
MPTPHTIEHRHQPRVQDAAPCNEEDYSVEGSEETYDSDEADSYAEQPQWGWSSFSAFLPNKLKEVQNFLKEEGITPMELMRPFEGAIQQGKADVLDAIGRTAETVTFLVDDAIEVMESSNSVPFEGFDESP